ncbi:MAG: LysR family transcriptional regulator [Oscillospiraceae bacterium]|nr:LysR family transcriptional regulator [Oscillospiraceae bacterium]
MELTQLRQFLKVAELGSITRAAQELYISQPALSNAIARLETELQVKLFDREGKRIALNDVGILFREYIANGIRMIDEGILRVRSFSDENTSIVRYSLSLGGLLAEEHYQYVLKHPDVKLRQYNLSSSQAKALLLEESLDMAIGFVPINAPEIEWYPLQRSELILLVSHDHPLSNRRTICLRELSEESFVSIDSSQELIEIFAPYCREAGYQPRVVFAGDDPRMLNNIIRQIHAIMVVPALLLETNPLFNDSQLHGFWEDLKPIRIADCHCPVTLGIGKCKDVQLSAAAKSFFQSILDRPENNVMK